MFSGICEYCKNFVIKFFAQTLLIINVTCQNKDKKIVCFIILLSNIHKYIIILHGGKAMKELYLTLLLVYFSMSNTEQPNSVDQFL